MEKVLSHRMEIIIIGALIIGGVIGVVLMQNGSAVAAGNIWYVASGGSDMNSCSSPAQPCATIQAAIDKASAGDTVLVANNGPQKSVIIAKDITLLGGWNVAFNSQDGMTTIEGLSTLSSESGIHVNVGSTVRIEFFRIWHTGIYHSEGGGIRNDGNLSIEHCVITENDGFMGSGVYNTGTMTISDCSIDHNYGASYGGGIFNTGDLTIMNSSIDHNSGSNGAGIYNGNASLSITGKVVVRNSSIWANQAYWGGGILNSGDVELINTTVAENYAEDLQSGVVGAGTSLLLSNTSVVSNRGTGLVADGGANVHLQNTIVMDNTYVDIHNMPYLDGYNLVGSVSYPEGGYIGPGNIIGVHEFINPIEGWPGYARLTATSQAIDHGDPAGCRDNHGNLLNFDMRGMPRVGRCDIGAFEMQPLDYSKFSADHSKPHTNSVVTYELNLNNHGAGVITGAQATNKLPVSFAYVPDSLKASSGTAAFDQGEITWNGSIEAWESVSIEYQANVLTTTGFITNTAVITTGTEVLSLSAVVEVVDKYYSYLPCTHRACLLSYTDNFSDPNSGWPIGGGSDYAMGYVDGEYFISASPGWVAWAVQDFGVSDFQIEVDARAYTTVDGAVGIIFDATDNGFYVFEVYEGWFALYRVDAYNWVPLIDWTESWAVNPGIGVNRLKVVRMGSGISVYANGWLLGSVEDSTYRSTYAGFATDSWMAYFEGRFDNVEVHSGQCNPGTPGIEGVWQFSAGGQVGGGGKVRP